MLKSASAALILVAAMVFSRPASAQHFNTMRLQQCDETRGAGDAGVRQCYFKALDAADSERQQVYGRILKVLSRDEAGKLMRGEDQWLLYRASLCSAEYDLYDGGTGGLSVAPTCRLSLTQHHISDLKDGFWWKVEKAAGG